MSRYCCSQSQRRVVTCARQATVTSSTGCCDERREQISYIGTSGNREAYKVYTPIHAENNMFVGIYTCMTYIRV